MEVSEKLSNDNVWVAGISDIPLGSLGWTVSIWSSGKFHILADLAALHSTLPALYIISIDEQT